MSFSGADTANVPAELIPALTAPVGHAAETPLTTKDLVVIAVSITIFFMIIFSVFFTRQLQYRRQRAMELKDAMDEERAECASEVSDNKPSIWKFLGWKDPNPEIKTACSPPEMGQNGKCIGGR